MVPLASIPTLHTERLTLRGPTEADFDVFAAFYASERSSFVGGPLPREQAYRILMQEAGHWQLKGFGRFSLVEKDTGATVGIVGLWNPVGFPENELGWDLFDGASGKGYATEAGAAVRAYAYSTLGWTTLISMIADGNEASVRVAKRLGARPDGTFTHERFGPMGIWRHPAPKEASNE
ncbi:GNAT family N-acetyltransferase [Ascidiaceihabitans sp.]|uniref:GNAT family N-acetyltransferase n=1 Tax=Ascidiaceihabitans sp. TaxID=1872644 RepID=UPI003296A75C